MSKTVRYTDRTISDRAANLGLDPQSGEFAITCIHGEHYTQFNNHQIHSTMRSYIYDCCVSDCGETK